VAQFEPNAPITTSTSLALKFVTVASVAEVVSSVR